MHPSGESFKIISVHFDPKLAMNDAAHSFAVEAGWRLRTLLRTQRFYTTATLFKLYKCHILSFIEGATPALYHAAPSVLKPLDDLQSNSLEQVGLTDIAALVDYNLAPLGMRRDIAMLGLLFKVASGTAPPPITNLFQLRSTH